MKKKFLLIALFFLVAVGVFALRQRTPAPFPSPQSRDIFDNGALTIYALQADDGGHEGANTFQGFKVLGSAQLAEPHAKELRAAFYENAAKEALPMMCFFHITVFARKKTVSKSI